MGENEKNSWPEHVTFVDFKKLTPEEREERKEKMRKDLDALAAMPSIALEPLDESGDWDRRFSTIKVGQPDPAILRKGMETYVRVVRSEPSPELRPQFKGARLPRKF